MSLWFLATEDIVCEPGPGGFPFVLRQGESVCLHGIQGLHAEFSDPQAVLRFLTEFDMKVCQMKLSGCGPDHIHTSDCFLGEILNDLNQIVIDLTPPSDRTYIIFEGHVGSRRGESGTIYEEGLPSFQEAYRRVHELRSLQNGYWYWLKPCEDVVPIEKQSSWW